MLVKVNIARNKRSGELELMVNAKELHADLDAIGVPSNNMHYLNQPSSDYSVINTAARELSPAVLLRKEYPATFQIGSLWRNPPSLGDLKSICNSAKTVVQRILLHYQPVDIQVTVHKVLVDNAQV